ncbi:hypothetical protein C0J52_17259 [Blattella germanica]|nr:hypothetical protein C0J52_17259 [Blattella germanica]
MLDLNVMGLSICTTEALQIMKENGIDDGHIIHINSVAGHNIPNLPTSITPVHMYAASKKAVLTLTEGLRRELVREKSKIRITSVSPGLVETEFLGATGRNVDAKQFYSSVPCLKAKDISDCVLFALAVPPHVQIHEIMELATKLKSQPGKLYSVKCDLTQEADITAAFQWIKSNLGRVDILINNAGASRASNLIGNIAGHFMPNTPITPVYMYGAAKKAVVTLTEGLRRELVREKSKIRVTSVSPGAVETEFLEVSGRDVDPKKFYSTFPCLQAKDVSDCVLFALSVPPHVQIHEIIELAVKLRNESGKLHALKCDVTKEEEIKEAFQWVVSNLGGIHILVNNAGIAKFSNLITGPTEYWKQIMDLNVLGLSICTSEALQIMTRTGVDDGHIIHINSIAGHTMPNTSLAVHMYGASKHAVTVLTEGLRRELVNQKSKIRVTVSIHMRYSNDVEYV